MSVMKLRKILEKIFEIESEAWNEKRKIYTGDDDVDINMERYYHLTDEEYEEYTSLLQKKDFKKTKEYLDNLRIKHDLTDEKLVYQGCGSCPHKCH